MLYEDYLQSGECWLNSTLVVNMNRNHNQKRRGRHTMMPFWQVKEKFGQAIGQQIYQDKKAMESSKKPGHANVYFMEHPECKGQNETCRLLITYICAYFYTPPCYVGLIFTPFTPTFSAAAVLAEEWMLLWIWDAMEFEDEHNESISVGLEARGEIDAQQTAQLL